MFSDTCRGRETGDRQSNRSASANQKMSHSSPGRSPFGDISAPYYTSDMTELYAGRMEIVKVCAGSHFCRLESVVRGGMLDISVKRHTPIRSSMDQLMQIAVLH